MKNQSLVLICTFLSGILVGGFAVDKFPFGRSEKTISTSTPAGKSLSHDLSRLAQETNPLVKQSIEKRVIKRLHQIEMREGSKSPIQMRESLDRQSSIDQPICNCEPAVINK
jgi:hypothetical protein